MRFAQSRACCLGPFHAGAMPSGGLVIHCLDVTQPVARQLAAEEALFTEAFGKRPSDA